MNPTNLKVFQTLFGPPMAGLGVGGKDSIEGLNPNSRQVFAVYVEPSLAADRAHENFQIERCGHFGAKRRDHPTGKVVLDLTLGLKDGKRT